MASAKTVRWGILATGGISSTMTKDLLIDPKTRGVEDVVHVIQAAASSSSKDSAEKFLDNYVNGKGTQGNYQAKAYGSYKELVSDPDVDIIYIGTPHSHHYQNCKLALEHNKPVLCEKALTVNAAQARELIREAGEKKLFFMEAVWTRYFPLSIEVRQAIKDGKIGEVIRVAADLSIGETSENFDENHRLVNLNLAGGVLLDLGVYALTWVFQSLYHTLPTDQRKSPTVKGVVYTPEPRTGADESTTMLLEFPYSSPGGKIKNAHAIATAALRTHFDFERDTPNATPAVRIFGTEGEIQVFGPIYRPSRYRIVYREEGKKMEDKTFEFPGDTHGMSWEGDEAARCLLAGKLESETLPWSESLAIMETMDEVRKQADLKFPEKIETTDYPVELGARGPGHVTGANRH